MKLWIDDLRDPPEEDWLVARSYEEAIEILKTGLVNHISFDHDLGTQKDGHDILTWLEEEIYFDRLPMPEEILVHSANPVGRNQMELAIRRLYEREGYPQQKS